MSNTNEINTIFHRIDNLPIELIRIIKDYTLDSETHLDYMINRYRYDYNNMLTLLENMSYHNLRTCYRLHIHRPIFQDPSSNVIENNNKIRTSTPFSIPFFDILPKTTYMLSRTHLSEQPHPFYSHIRERQYEHNEMSTEGQNRAHLARNISQIFRIMESGNTFHDKMNRRMREIALGLFRGFILLRRIVNGQPIV